ncbi:uncharacterized protein METZ01_LOCUS84834, partial [marine metagenome]
SNGPSETAVSLSTTRPGPKPTLSPSTWLAKPGPSPAPSDRPCCNSFA